MSPDIRETNRSMVERILSAPGAEPADGGYALRVLETSGRRSGDPRRTPIAIVRRDGRDHLVSPDPTRDWVRNLRADPAARIVTDEAAHPVRAVEVDADEGVPVVRAYLAAMAVPWAIAAFPVAADASPAEVRAHMDTIAVFRLDPADR